MSGSGGIVTQQKPTLCRSCGKHLDVVCPNCGGTEATPIVYGLPGADLYELADHGSVFLGGCVISDWDPTHMCNTCGTSWGHPARYLVPDSDSVFVCDDPRCRDNYDRVREEWEILRG